MSKLDDLIQAFCPDGVEYFELQEIFKTRNGYTPSKSVAVYWKNGTLPWFKMEDIRQNGALLSDSIEHITPKAVKGNLFEAGSVIISTSATIGEHALILVDFLANQRFTCLTRKDEIKAILDPKFVYYYCFVLDEWCRSNVNFSGFASVDMPGFHKFKFPLPPLKVQEEIVRILDKFTILEAELKVRSKQYTFYRDRLLSFKEAEK